MAQRILPTAQAIANLAAEESVKIHTGRKRGGRRVQAARQAALETAAIEVAAEALGGAKGSRRSADRRVLNTRGQTYSSRIGDVPTNSGEKFEQHRTATRNSIRNDSTFYELTPDGANWLMVALNPCDVSARNRGYPDMEVAPVVTPSEREKFDVNVNLGATDTSAPDQAELWNLILISDPATLATYTYIYQGSVSSPTYSRILTNQDRIRPHLIESAFMASRVTAYGTTIEFTGPTLSDQGVMLSSQLKSGWTKVKTQNTGTAPVITDYYAWPLEGGTGVDAAPNELFDFLRENMEADPQSFASAAKVGSYAVHKMNEPSLLMRNHNLKVGVETADAAFVINPFYSITTNTPTNPLTIPSTMILPLFSSELNAWNANIFWATGLSTASSFNVKKYVHIEGQIAPRSALRYYSHAPPCVDENALHAYNRLIEKMPSAYPSEYNAFGWLKKTFNWIGGAFKKGVDIFKKVKPIIDIVKPIIGGGG